MFKRGGSSFQAQGTGITSPYDTPRKSYQLGSWGEWEQKTRELTQDPRGDWSYAAQGFSELGNPYKESGEAKTIGEMLYAGAAGVRGSKDRARELEQKGELAILESQGGRMLAAEKHKRDIELAKLKSSDDYLKKTPLPRLILDMTTQILKTSNPGSFEYLNASGLAKGKAIAAKMAGDGITVGVIEDWIDLDPPNNKWDYKADNMRADIPWFDPVKGVWHVFNAGENGMVTGEPLQSFLTVEEAVAYIKGGNQEIIKKDETLGESNAKEVKKKVVKKGTTQEEMEKSAKDTTEKIKERFTWEGDVRGDNPYKKDELVTDFDETQKIVYRRAKGGRIGAATGYSPLGVTIPEPDKDATELEELNAWWKSQLKSKDITDEG
jgi:hypothetical protein